MKTLLIFKAMLIVWLLAGTATYVVEYCNKNPVIYTARLDDDSNIKNQKTPVVLNDRQDVAQSNIIITLAIIFLIFFSVISIMRHVNRMMILTIEIIRETTFLQMRMFWTTFLFVCFFICLLPGGEIFLWEAFLKIISFFLYLLSYF